MKLTLLLGLLLFAIAAVMLVRHRRAVRDAATAAANARARAAARRNRVPAVSNNLKGVTASQTIEPVKPSRIGLFDDDPDEHQSGNGERAA